jgi:hypothetical protein
MDSGGVVRMVQRPVHPYHPGSDPQTPRYGGRPGVGTGLSLLALLADARLSRPLPRVRPAAVGDHAALLTPDPTARVALAMSWSALR